MPAGVAAPSSGTQAALPADTVADTVSMPSIVSIRAWPTDLPAKAAAFAEVLGERRSAAGAAIGPRRYLWPMDWRDRIASDKDVLLGKPVIKGTRISVELVLELLAEGWSEKQVLESYPHITRADIQAVFAYLRDGMRHDLYLPLRRSA
ncbi:MAG: DUF433 domain-containing protein [Flavobacteriales bacterium]|jgi:uncharacterized protein (DUF433 family)|nr:DUF433 domain-containing protein [Flavobacteriales bacterium]